MRSTFTVKISDQKLASSLGGLNKDIQVILCKIDQDHAIKSVEEAYLKLHLLSYKFFQPNTLNLDNLFNVLPNVAWTNQGPMDLDGVDQKILDSKVAKENLEIKSINKDKCWIIRLSHTVSKFAKHGVPIPTIDQWTVYNKIATYALAMKPVK